jgi:hypothetical protein
MKDEHYRKVYIKSEEDLPKEKGYYIACTKENALHYHYHDKDRRDNDLFWEDFDWYLLPYEPTSLREELIKFNSKSLSPRFWWCSICECYIVYMDSEDINNHVKRIHPGHVLPQETKMP